MRGCIKDFNEEEAKYDNKIKEMIEEFLEHEFEGFGYLNVQFINEMLQFIEIIDEIYSTSQKILTTTHRSVITKITYHLLIINTLNCKIYIELHRKFITLRNILKTSLLPSFSFQAC